MPCYHPRDAAKTADGKILIGRPTEDLEANQHRLEPTSLRISCGNCIGCRTAHAQAWAFRCWLENSQHDQAAFITLTYNDRYLPVTLSKHHVQLFQKRLRQTLRRSESTRRLRLFVSGEYGETRRRPHYHAIVWGLSPDEKRLVQRSWREGFTDSEPVTPGRIAYVARYVQKKLAVDYAPAHERVNTITGEIYRYQPPFILMSRGGKHGHGIGGHARQWPTSWRLYAIDSNGNKITVPRFLHQAWKDQATLEQQEALANEKTKRALTRDASTPRLLAAEQLEHARQNLNAARRPLE